MGIRSKVCMGQDVRWYGTGQTRDLSANSHTLAYCLHGGSQDDVDLYVMINAFWEDLVFEVLEGKTAEWHRVVDTSCPSPSENGGAECLSSLSYKVRGPFCRCLGEALKAFLIGHLK